MSKSLDDLNSVLFSQIDKLNGADKDDLDIEIKRAKSMVSIADKVIGNSRLIHDIYESQGGLKTLENRPEILRVKRHTVNGS